MGRVCYFCVAFLCPLLLSLQPAAAFPDSFETWLARQEHFSAGMLMQNISPTGTRTGTVVASPSRQHPDYFYHWVRDAGLTMDVVVSLYEKAPTKSLKLFYQTALLDFATFSRENQLSALGYGGLGEPKFFVDGRPYNLPWARPQNDGPAIRAIPLIRFAKILITRGQAEVVSQYLYDSRLPAHSVIKADLEFVAHHWRETSFDVWEEVRGMHFFTLLFQRQAMVLGAELADLMQDSGAANFYRTQAQAMRAVIEQHWDENLGYLKATLERNEGVDYKYSGLDSAVIIAALRADLNDGFFSPGDGKVLSTAHAIERAFKEIYPINWNPSLGTAIGRYPEDTYDGYVTNSHGNPWVLATCTYAELYYKVAQAFIDRGQVQITTHNYAFLRALPMRMNIHVHDVISATDPRFNLLIRALRLQGDGYLQRLRVHVDAIGSLSEQMNRNTGFMQGAPHLTWSYAAFLTAIWARN